MGEKAGREFMAAQHPPAASEHAMVAGSHERPSGPECRCGAQWSRSDGLCAATAPWSMLSEKGRAERLASMPNLTSDEAIEHVKDTGHSVEWNEECRLWACFDCPWTDSNFQTLPAAPVAVEGVESEPRLRPAVPHGPDRHRHGDWIIDNDKCPWCSPAVEGVETALTILSDLSGCSTDGRLRDAIALVRSALWDELDTPVNPETSKPEGER